MGHNEIGSVILMTLAAITFGIFVSAFIYALFVMFNLSDGVHKSSYEVN